MGGEVWLELLSSAGMKMTLNENNQVSEMRVLRTYVQVDAIINLKNIINIINSIVQPM